MKHSCWVQTGAALLLAMTVMAAGGAANAQSVDWSAARENRRSGRPRRCRPACQPAHERACQRGMCPSCSPPFTGNVLTRQGGDRGLMLYPRGKSLYRKLPLWRGRRIGQRRQRPPRRQQRPRNGPAPNTARASTFRASARPMSLKSDALTLPAAAIAQARASSGAFMASWSWRAADRGSRTSFSLR